MGFLFTPEILDKALALHEVHEVPYPQVADRLGLNYPSLLTVLSKYRKGQLTFRYAKQQEENERIAQMVENGATPREAADAVGRSQSGIHNTLRRLGLDRATRAQLQLRKPRKPRVRKKALGRCRLGSEAAERYQALTLRILELHDDGLPARLVATRAGCSLKTVHRRLKKLGQSQTRSILLNERIADLTAKGRSRAEVAAEVGISKSAVQSRIQRMRKQLPAG